MTSLPAIRNMRVSLHASTRILERDISPHDIHEVIRLGSPVQVSETATTLAPGRIRVVVSHDDCIVTAWKKRKPMNAKARNRRMRKIERKIRRTER